MAVDLKHNTQYHKTYTSCVTFIIHYILHITPLPIPTLWHDNNCNYYYILKRIRKNNCNMTTSLLMHLHINIVPRYLTCVKLVCNLYLPYYDYG